MTKIILEIEFLEYLLSINNDIRQQIPVIKFAKGVQRCSFSSPFVADAIQAGM